MGTVIAFDSVKRTAQIAAKRCHDFHYGLTTTQQLQIAAVRFHQNTGKPPAYSAMRLVRPPNEPFFGGPEAA